jgi:hypothetical protein
MLTIALFFVGGDTPQDRTLDGVDQSDFFMAKVEKSPRETVMIYIGNELFGANGAIGKCSLSTSKWMAMATILNRWLIHHFII